MQKLTAKKLTVIKNNINNNKAIMKQINSNTYTSVENFIQNAEAYINAIQERRMLNIIKTVSNSGMSRVLKFMSYEIYKEKNNNNIRISRNERRFSYPWLWYGYGF